MQKEIKCPHFLDTTIYFPYILESEVFGCVMKATLIKLN